MKNNVNIEHGARKITITKEFARKANVVGSEEYRMLVRLRQDFPDYAISTKEVKKRANKKRFAKLTYENMGRYIELTYQEDSAEYIAFIKVMELATTQAAQYAFVKKWFLDSFPDYNKTPVWDNMDSAQEEYDTQSTDTQTDAKAS